MGKYILIFIVLVIGVCAVDFFQIVDVPFINFTSLEEKEAATAGKKRHEQAQEALGEKVVDEWWKDSENEDGFGDMGETDSQ